MYWVLLDDDLIRVTLQTIRFERALRFLCAIRPDYVVAFTRSLEMLRVGKRDVLEFLSRLGSADDLLWVKDIVLMTTC
jgi:hypothetical protein